MIVNTQLNPSGFGISLFSCLSWTNCVSKRLDVLLLNSFRLPQIFVLFFLLRCRPLLYGIYISILTSLLYLFLKSSSMNVRSYILCFTRVSLLEKVECWVLSTPIRIIILVFVSFAFTMNTHYFTEHSSLIRPLKRARMTFFHTVSFFSI